MRGLLAARASTGSRLAAVLLVATMALASATAAREATRPELRAHFAERSYAPGDRAALVVRTRAVRARVQVFRIGAGRSRMPGERTLVGEPVGSERELALWADARGRRHAAVRVGAWESGLYFLRVAVGRRARYAPFVLRPSRLGRSRIAVVFPTNTWQAYNRLDENGDGIGDTWYAAWEQKAVSLSRPYVGRGIPPFFESYDLGFLRYLDRTRRAVDMLADDDLERFASGSQLARLYDLIVFAGHEEYVTKRVYDLVAGYRDAGGHLMFLSANNFFWRVAIRNGSMRRVGRWRDLGRPEARLIGVQYLDWNHGRRPAAPLVVQGARRARWLFAGTGVANGSRFGHFGIEIDTRTHDSPARAIAVARLPRAFGRRHAAEMTYYETKAGARVFAAGVMNYGGSASNPVVARMLDNLFARLGPADDALARARRGTR